ncbi:hypothetical protein CONCODRAFT_138233 [Conidiobolus coronatus NRRL 28638]|uniref:Uncharacterized protein n=1 Tax=Conidiobolus coronatus (strain ATCC 28846 / CBS 209.66 / NRRL 28638) TaxID=796925 RepID=A0A137NSN9_CONC2|nr:hypothetical protein CONCODRAFT_138233 [Conidiobolus coronatus NRRL 28638]|eukprot:KXN65731.1 hypothetical protein CONCODRAFT_138233 [Conidiobolus coronatus NRRL 28638]
MFIVIIYLEVAMELLIVYIGILITKLLMQCMYLLYTRLISDSGTGRINQDLLNYIASGSSNLTKLTIKRYIFHVNGLSVPTFNFITDLILGQFHLNHTLGASICLNCPNLINLTITLTHGDIINQFNIMLEYIAKSFKSLKKFELIVIGGYVFSLKFHYLTTIQTLILRNYHRWTIDLMAKYFPPHFRNTRDIHIPSGEVVVLNK